MDTKEKARALLKAWKGEDYVFGNGVLGEIGGLVSGYGKKVLVVGTTHRPELTDAVIRPIEAAGGEVLTGKIIPGARPNAPREDVYRITTYILRLQPDCVVAVGGGSNIDACKAAVTLACLGDVSSEIDYYFGTGIVTDALEKTGRKLLPLVAVETASSSGAHLTKYSNITDPAAGQKKLIVDPAVVPAAALFDYGTTATMPENVTVDGALDGIAHVLEVFFGAKPEAYDLTKEIFETALELVVSYTKKAIEKPDDAEAREALGLATDLGGYAIMVGGTSGGHLTSFSLVDLVNHGTACGIMNPYYTVFYAPAIQEKLLVAAEILGKYGFMEADAASLTGRDRAIAVSEGLLRFSRSIGAPVKLSELPGFTEAHVTRILTAAKDPQLKMKLQNMPVPMTSEDVYPYMESVILAAATGDPQKVINK